MITYGNQFRSVAGTIWTVLCSTRRPYVTCYRNGDKTDIYCFHESALETMERVG